MSLKDQLESDILLFFHNIEKQLPSDQHKALKTLIEKYAHLSMTNAVLDKEDFEKVKDHAREFLVKSSFPKYLGNKKTEVSSSEANVLSIIEGTIIVLNSKECFKKLPRFDYRD